MLVLFSILGQKCLSDAAYGKKGNLGSQSKARESVVVVGPKMFVSMVILNLISLTVEVMPLGGLCCKPGFVGRCLLGYCYLHLTDKEAKAQKHSIKLA